ncbi:MAG: amidohydrolase family protein [Burkholderiaceae bacterium]
MDRHGHARAPLLERHSVAIAGDRIAAIGPRAQIRARHPDVEPVALAGHLLIPGLVNLHTHAAMSLLRGIGDDLSLHRWLQERIWPTEGKLVSPSFVYDGSLLACREMLLGGITCFNDMYFYPEETARAAALLGMRARVGIIVIDFPSAYGTGPRTTCARASRYWDRHLDDPLIGFCLAPPLLHGRRRCV